MGEDDPKPVRTSGPQPGETWRRFDGALVRIVERNRDPLGTSFVVAEVLAGCPGGTEVDGQRCQVLLSDFSRTVTWRGDIEPGTPLYRKAEEGNEG
jgi:hypothetical protein